MTEKEEDLLYEIAIRDDVIEEILNGFTPEYLVIVHGITLSRAREICEMGRFDYE